MADPAAPHAAGLVTQAPGDPSLSPDVRAQALTIWNYHRIGHALAKSDAILVLCSHDTIVAEHAAAIYLQGWAPLLIFSGGHGAITRRLWTEPEAEIFARIARDRGVPADRILTEPSSTNTGENIAFTRILLESKGLTPRSVIVVQKPYMERRSYATMRQVWPEVRVVVTSPPLSFDEYLAQHAGGPLSDHDIVSIMVGDLQRIRLYPKRGFQIRQEIPDDVWDAFQALVAAGFDSRLVPGGDRR